MSNRKTVSLAKADPLLREALRNAGDQEVVRAVLVLRHEFEGRDEPELSPSAYPSRVEYRRALIERQRRRLKEGEVGRTVGALQRMDLKPRGGDLLEVVVVEGTADKVASALELPGVVRGEIDRPVRLVDPRPSEE
jgi:hypothetical protein